MPDFQERRRQPRVTVRAPLTARVGATLDARVLDLSLGGVRLQHAGHLRPGAPCVLELPTTVCPRFLRGRIVHSAVVTLELTATGAQDLCYESGIAFEPLRSDQEVALARALERLAAPEGIQGA